MFLLPEIPSRSLVRGGRKERDGACAHVPQQRVWRVPQSSAPLHPQQAWGPRLIPGICPGQAACRLCSTPGPFGGCTHWEEAKQGHCPRASPVLGLWRGSTSPWRSQGRRVTGPLPHTALLSALCRGSRLLLGLYLFTFDRTLLWL